MFSLDVGNWLIAVTISLPIGVPLTRHNDRRKVGFTPAI